MPELPDPPATSYPDGDLECLDGVVVHLAPTQSNSGWPFGRSDALESQRHDTGCPISS